MKKKVKVVAAIIENENNEVLCALRAKERLIGGYWEFPGGKVEKNESLKDAIEREIFEELGCNIVSDGNIFNEYIHEYEKFIIDLIVLKCTLVSGSPIAKEHAKLLWLDKSYLESLNWAPADIPAVKALV